MAMGLRSIVPHFRPQILTFRVFSGGFCDLEAIKASKKCSNMIFASFANKKSTLKLAEAVHVSSGTH